MTETFITVSFLHDLITHSTYLRAFESDEMDNFKI